MDNILNNIGESLIVNTDGPTTGVISVDGFSDDVQGETASRTLKREFQYTIDGINFSDWEILNSSNLTSINVSPKNDFDIRYRFTREGSDTSGSIEWNWINIECTVQEIDCGDAYRESSFNNFFSCSDEKVLAWCLNVTRKLYDAGIVSSTLDRSDNSNGSDNDYIDFWRTVSCFFSMIVNYGRVFQNFDDHQRLLENYLIGRGLYIHNDHDHVDLLSFKRRFHEEIAKRGTSDDSETKRLISYNPSVDEFQHSMTDIKSIGWTLDAHSPLYRGGSINKIEPIVGGINNYPIVGNVQVVDDQGLIHQIDPVDGDVSGLGSLNPIVGESFNVDSKISYQVQFLAKVTDVNCKISVSVNGWDAAANISNPSPTTLGATTSLDKISLPRANEYFLIRVIIFPYTTPLSLDQEYQQTTMGGSNLKFFSQTTKIFPNIFVDDRDSNSSGSLFVKDFNLSMASSPYSKGFVGGQQIQEYFLKNNSGRYNNDDVMEAIRRNSPYRSGVKITYL